MVCPITKGDHKKLQIKHAKKERNGVKNVNVQYSHQCDYCVHITVAVAVLLHR